jgi:hypothetical protein
MGTVPTQLEIVARIPISLAVDAVEAHLVANGRIASISNAEKLTQMMFSIKMSLGLASIASANLKTTNPPEESNFVQVLSLRNFQKDAYLRRQSSTPAPW